MNPNNIIFTKKGFILLCELEKHPHICQVIEFVQNKEAVFGVLGFIDGLYLNSKSSPVQKWQELNVSAGTENKCQ